MTEDDDILAAEYALGLLAADDALATEARLRADAALSLRVAWWRDQLGPLAAEAEVEPDTRVWRMIETRIGANDNVPDRVRPWKWATGGMGAVAAALLAVIALRPDPAPIVVTAPPTAVPMVASLSGKPGVAVAVAFDADAKRLVVTPVALDPGTGDAELWVIPVGQTVPVSLGVIDSKSARTHELTPSHVALLTGEATFAISLEAKGGSTTGAPQGPVVASGKLIRI
jgi:anti-sigma-K factor RskA